jgi:hypothetical protein
VANHIVETLFQEELNALFSLKPKNSQALAELCQRFIALHPNFHKPYLALALIARKANLPEEALRLTHQAIQKAPFDPQAQIMYRSLKESL